MNRDWLLATYSAGYAQRRQLAGNAQAAMA